ncbi:citrate lyase subunit alpha, partial [Escherichia sp. HC-CC]
ARSRSHSMETTLMPASCRRSASSGRARLLTGEPQPIEFTDRVVAVVRYRDGSVIDVVHQVKE